HHDFTTLTNSKLQKSFVQHFLINLTFIPIYCTSINYHICFTSIFYIHYTHFLHSSIHRIQLQPLKMEGFQISYERIQRMAKFVEVIMGCKPRIGIICGAGMLPIFDIVESRNEIKYSQIPGFPAADVGPQGNAFVYGNIACIPVIIQTDRFMFYEGYTLDVITLSVKLFYLLGATELIVLTSAFSINPSYKPGDVMIMKDQLNMVGLCGSNPLRGPNDERFGDRCPSMIDCFERAVYKHARRSAEELGWGCKIHTGVYASISGPTTTTAAEANMLRMFGVDAVGMTSVHEVIAGRHCDMAVCGLALVTAMARLDYGRYREPTAGGMAAVVAENVAPLQDLLVKIVQFMGVKRVCKCINKGDLEGRKSRKSTIRS
ncbi:unnamed protein product, partial [Phyllotreta striolata]